MKNTLLHLFASVLTLTSLSLAQDDISTLETSKSEKAKPQYLIDLEALTQDQKKNYIISYNEANRLFKQKRIFECLNHIHSLELIYSKNPSALNLKGACYVEFRNFDKARAAFKKALKESPESFNVHFNVAEIDFVTENYARCMTILQKLREDAKDDPHFQSMAPLVDFKILLCMLKTGDEAGAQKIVAGTDFLDDSLLFYYGNAALDYYADRRAEAEVWLERAGRIFRNSNSVAPWQDTLIEFGYIKSFYGGDLETGASK